jgi:hypothetical protein
MPPEVHEDDHVRADALMNHEGPETVGMSPAGRVLEHERHEMDRRT